MFIVKIAESIGHAHAKFFMWVSRKAETNPWFATLMTLVALYEIFEHIVGPTLAILFASGHLSFK